MSASGLTWRSTRLILVLAAALLSGCALFSEDDEDGKSPAPLTDIKVEQRFDRLWSRDIGDGQGKLFNRLRPAVSGDTLVAASAEGRVEAFDRHNGKRLWATKLRLSLTGGVAIGGSRVFVSSTDGRLWALDLATGEKLWRRQVGSEVLAPAVADAEVVAVATADSRLVGFDADDGSPRWNYSSSSPVLSLRAGSAPLLFEGAVIAGFANGRVVAVSRDSGQLFWESRAGVSQGSSEIERLIDVAGDPLIADGVLFVVAYQGELSALDLRSGRRLWARKASSFGSLSEGYSNIYVATAEGSVIAFDRNGQGVRWEQSVLARRQLSGTATWGSYVAVGDFEGYVHLLSQADGRIVARTRVDSDGVRVAPLVVDDILYVYGNSGTLAAYRLKSVE
jgi:outer membrane protein assembly factor BamB